LLYVRWEVTNGVAVVSIDHPPLNILSTEVKRELKACFEELRAREEVRAVVLTGAGDRAFSAGADLREFPDRIRLGNAREVAREGQGLTRAIAEFPKPTVAAVNGLALGAGCELVLFFDFRLASERASFGFPEIKRGVFPGNGGTVQLCWLLGAGRARELLLLGEPIDAWEAYRIGLVSRVVPHEQLVQEALALTSKLARRPGVAVQFIKRLAVATAELPMDQALELEADLFGKVFKTEDVKEGVRAFFEKREPDFKHR
jgi:enoyl-CoA hydratase